VTPGSQTAPDVATLPGPIPGGYAGTYWSDELAASFVISIAGDTLSVKLPGGTLLPLRRTGEATFRSRGAMSLEFDAPRDGRSAAFVLGLGRVRGLRFVRAQADSAAQARERPSSTNESPS
jgi:hypothetical protein